MPAALGALGLGPIRTLNFGKVGASSRWGRANVEQVCSALADVVIIEFGSNDAALHHGVTLANSQSNVSHIIQRLRQARTDTQLYLMTMSPARGMRGLIRPRLASFFAAYERLAASEQVGLIDNRPRLESALQRRTEARSSGRHASGTGF